MRDESGGSVLDHYTSEEVRQAREAEAQQEIFIGQVNDIIDEKVKRGEGPSRLRIPFDFALQGVGEVMMTKQYGRKPAGRKAEAAHRWPPHEKTGRVGAAAWEVLITTGQNA